MAISLSESLARALGNDTVSPFGYRTSFSPSIMYASSDVPLSTSLPIV